MAAFRIDQELVYEKSPAETLTEMEKAFAKIGKVVKLDYETGKLSGKTKYGLNEVIIDTEVTEYEGKTKIVFHGKSGDIAAIGARNGIARLVAAMQYSNADGTEIPEVKASVGKLIFMWIFAALGGLIGVFLASSVLNAKNVDGSPKYSKAHRNQAMVALIISICMTVFYFVIYSIN
jgi:hypothetical protein